MDYEGFVDYIDNLLKTEMSASYDDIRLYRSGYVPFDEEEKNSLRAFSIQKIGLDTDSLVMDVLSIKQKSGNGDTAPEYISLREIFYDLKSFGSENSVESFSCHRLVFSADDSALTASYDEIKDKLIIRPLNYDLHKRFLGGAIYKRCDDIVLAVYQKVSVSDGILSTRKILKSDLERWGMVDKEEDIIQAALLNSQRLNPACVFNKYTHSECDFFTGNFTKKDISIAKGQIFLSAFRSSNGAAALFYPGVAEKLRKIMGGEFNVVFLNVNAVMIYDKNNSCAVSDAQMAADSSVFAEMLSGKCYRYDGEKLFVING